MVDETDLLPTPANYATPNQLALAREYAKALLWGNRDKGNGVQFPVVSHWTQGVSNMVNALLGGKEMYDTQHQENATVRAGARDLPERQEPTPDVSPSETSDTPIDTGPKRVHTVSYAPDPTLGPQAPTGGGGMGRDYKPGIEPDDSPLYEPRGTKPDNMDIPPDPQASFNDRWGDFGSSTKPPMAALPFNVEASAAAAANGGVLPANGIDAIAKALALKGGAPKNPFGVPVGAPTDTNYVDPRTLPKRPQITRDQLERIMSNQMIPAESKAIALKSYYEQFQPLATDYPGGHVIVDPVSGAQRLVPDVKDRTTELPGGLKISEPGFVAPPGTLPNLRYQTVPNASGAAPAPSGASKAPLGGPPAPNLKEIPGLLKYAPDDEEPTGPLGATPPIGPIGPTSGAAPGAQVAQLSPRTQQLYDWAQGKQLDFERAKDFNQADVKAFDKDYNTYNTAGQRAAQSMPMLQLADKLIDNDNYYSGIGGKAVMTFQQLRAALGKDPTVAAPMEIFEKIISGQIVDDMKITLQGLGQVRVAEIDLLSKAAASLDRTKTANHAVLDLMMRVHKQADVVSRAANAYRQGYRLNGDGDWVQTSEAPTKAGLDATVRRVTDAMPTLSAEQIAGYNKAIGRYDPAKYEAKKRELMDAAEGKTPEAVSPNEPAKKKAPPPPPGYQVR